MLYEVITEGEEDELTAQKARLNSAEKIMDALSASYAALYEREPFNALAALKDVSRRLQSIADVDAQYEQMAARVDEAYYIIEEVSSAVSGGMDTELFDPNLLEQVEERLALIASMKRKYGDPTRITSYNVCYTKLLRQPICDDVIYNRRFGICRSKNKKRLRWRSHR